MRGNYGKLFLLLNKRLLKKPSFIILLCMIPVIVFGLHLVSERETAVAVVAGMVAMPAAFQWKEITAVVAEVLDISIHL